MGLKGSYYQKIIINKTIKAYMQISLHNKQRYHILDETGCISVVNHFTWKIQNCSTMGFGYRYAGFSNVP